MSEEEYIQIKRDIRTRLGNYFLPKGMVVLAEIGQGDKRYVFPKGKDASVRIMLDGRDYREFKPKWLRIK